MRIIRHTIGAIALAGAVGGLATGVWAQDDPPAEREASSPAAGEEGQETEGGGRKFQGFYWRGGLGLVGLADSGYRAPGGMERDVQFDPGFGMTTAIGYDFGSVFQPRATANQFTLNLRSEVEYSFERVDADDPGGPGSRRLEKLSTYGFAVNTYLDFDTPTAWTFYTGFGVGAARIESEGSGFSSRDTSGFIQLMGGAIFDVNRRVSLYAGLRSRGYSDFNIGDSELQDLASGTLEVGLLLSF